MSSKSPAFQFYPGDFLSDANVAVMSAEEVGAYLLLTLYAWRENGLPDDIEELALLGRIAPDRFKTSWERRIQRCFAKREDGRWVHPRLERERVKQQEFRDKMSEAGKRGGRGQRKGRPKVGSATPSESERVPSALLSSISNSNTTTEQSVETLPPVSRRRSSKKRGLVMTEQEAAFFGYYRSKHPRRGPPDDDQIRLVRKGYLSFDDGQMRQAVDGNLEDPWCVKNGKHEIGWIFRNNDSISQAIEHYHRAHAPLFDDKGKLTPDGQRVFGSAA